MLNVRRLIVVIVLCLAAARADAQTSPDVRERFVNVSLGPDWDDAYSFSTRVPGATWRSGFAFGVDRERSGVEVDVSVPQWHVQNQPPLRYRYAGTTVGWEQQGHAYEWSATVRRRSTDATLLYRRNMPIDPHVRLSCLVGAGYVSRPEKVDNVTKEVLPDGQLIEANSNQARSSRNYLAAVARLDLELRVATRVSVVPRLRITAFPSLLDESALAPRPIIARPEVAVRWRF